MEPANKKAKLITDHFRVALKPRDLNVPHKKKAIEVVTIHDDENERQQHRHQHHHQNHHHRDHRHPLHNQQDQFYHDEKSKKTLAALPQPLAPSQRGQTQQPIYKYLAQSQQTTATICSQQQQQHQKQPLQQHHSISQSQPQALTTAKVSKSQKAKRKHASPSPLNKYISPPGKQASVVDYDQNLLNNVHWEPHYAWDSFNYDREQELKFRTIKYLGNNHICDQSLALKHQQHDFTPKLRAELVDWLVEIQTDFSLDHEPLYMAVKLADQYLMRKYVAHDDQQLLFMTCILVSSKFDERIPPLTISDLIQTTYNRFGIRYSAKQITSFEVDLLTTLNFDIRFPLSYGFLRRFARCTRSDMRTINLARYILETSLMDYEMIDLLESKIAAGSLLLAFEMLHLSEAWDETAKFYTGYNEKDLYPLLVKLNDMIMRLSKRRTVVRGKYSHKSFMEVARIPPILPELLETMAL